MVESAHEIATRIRLRAVPDDGTVARGQYSQAAIDTMYRDGYITPVERDRYGRIRTAKLSTFGHKAAERLTPRP